MDGRASRPRRRVAGGGDVGGAHRLLIAPKSQNERSEATCASAFVSSSPADSPRLPTQDYMMRKKPVGNIDFFFFL